LTPRFVLRTNDVAVRHDGTAQESKRGLGTGVDRHEFRHRSAVLGNDEFGALRFDLVHEVEASRLELARLDRSWGRFRDAPLWSLQFS
jgi:hypothetical protein